LDNSWFYLTERDIVILELTKTHPKPGVTVILMKGSIHTGLDCRRVESETEALIKASELFVIFDLGQVTHIDSAAIGSLVRAFTRLKASGGSLRLAGCKGMIEASLKLTKLHKVLDLYPTATEAAESFPPPKSHHIE
jgi:anti-sigma B factor antagonist